MKQSKPSELDDGPSSEWPLPEQLAKFLERLLEDFNRPEITPDEGETDNH